MFFGPADLAWSYGIHNPTDETLWKEIIIPAAKKVQTNLNKPVGTLTVNPTFAVELFNKHDFSFIACSIDTFSLKKGVDDLLDYVHEH